MDPNRTLFIHRGALRRTRAIRNWLILLTIICSPILIFIIAFRSTK